MHNSMQQQCNNTVKKYKMSSSGESGLDASQLWSAVPLQAQASDLMLSMFNQKRPLQKEDPTGQEMHDSGQHNIF